MTDIDELNLDPIVRAQGVALSLIGAVLERQGGLPKGEFAQMLGLMSTLTAETDTDAADILAAWTLVAKQAAERSLKTGLTQ